MIESELLNERVGQRIDVRSNKGQIRRLRRQVDNGNQTAFNRQWRNEFMNLDASDFSNEKYGELLQSTTNAAVAKGWLEGSGGVFALSAGMTSAGTVDLDPEVQVTPAQSSEVSGSDIRMLDYLSNGGSVLKFGSSGSKVTALQNILNARLQSHGKEDRQVEVTGTFDSATKTAVETMQGVYGLQVDGIVGRQTWTALKSDGAESAAVTPRAETAPADGAATADEEAAAAAAAAASPTVRPEKPGPMFIWDRDKNVWYAYHNHYYHDGDPSSPVYSLWIVKDDEDFHIKMESGDTWANVTQSDIDSLETQAMMDAAAAAVDVVAPDPDEAQGDETDASGEPEIATENKDYSLARVMLLEFNTASTSTNNNPKNSTRDNVGRQGEIFTFEQLEANINDAVQDFSRSIRQGALFIKKEANKGFWSNSDESGSIEKLEDFSVKSDELYDSVAADVMEIKLNFENEFDKIASLDKSPSSILASLAGFPSVENMIEELDDYMAGDNFVRMKTIIQSHSAPVKDRQATLVVASGNNNAAEVAQLNQNLLILQTQVKTTAKIIAANSYDKRFTGAGIANMIGSAALGVAAVATGGVSAAAIGTTRAAVGATRLARMTNIAARTVGGSARAIRTAGVAVMPARVTAGLARLAGAMTGTNRVVAAERALYLANKAMPGAVTMAARAAKIAKAEAAVRKAKSIARVGSAASGGRAAIVYAGLNTTIGSGDVEDSELRDLDRDLIELSNELSSQTEWAEDGESDEIAANHSMNVQSDAVSEYLDSKGMLDAAGNIAAAGLGLDAFGDGADESLVVAAMSDFNSTSQEFYTATSELIARNNIVLETPAEMLFKEYNFNVTSEDEATSIPKMIDEMNEFLEGSNLDDVRAYINDNNITYDEWLRISESVVNNKLDVFTYDRFSKLAGLLKG